MSFDRKEYLEKCASQRAALMALVDNVVSMSDDASVKDAKMMISSCFSKMIDGGIMVGDPIDNIVLESLKAFLEQEQALRAADEIINPDKPL
jgi:hypothetical protein